MKSIIRHCLSPKLIRYIRLSLKLRILKTLYINLSLLPLKEALKLPIIVLGKTKIRSLSGKLTFHCPVKFGLIAIGADVDEMPITFVPAQINLSGKLNVHGNVILNKGASLVVWRNAEMNLGNDVMICSGCLVKAVNNVTIGNHVMISSGCFIMDSSIHCLYDTTTNKPPPPTGSIIIGDNVWLNMYTDIIKSGGAPTGCITTRYAFISTPFDSSDANCILAGQPAKIIKRNITQVHNFSTERFINSYFADNPEEKSLLLSQAQTKSENLCQQII